MDVSVRVYSKFEPNCTQISSNSITCKRCKLSNEIGRDVTAGRLKLLDATGKLMDVLSKRLGDAILMLIQKTRLQKYKSEQNYYSVILPQCQVKDEYKLFSNHIRYPSLHILPGLVEYLFSSVKTNFLL